MDINRNQDFDAFDPVDIKRIFNALRRGFLLIVLGFIFGLGIAYLVSKLQTPIYAASTQVMVARSNSQGPVTDITQQLSSQQVAQTYVELLSQDWVRDNVTARVGGARIDKSHIKINAATNTQIIRIIVEDTDPSRAIVIADMFVVVLAEQNESIQSTRYTESEVNLDLQITELETKIAGLQNELDAATHDALAHEIASVEKNISEIQAAISSNQAELDKLNEINDAGNVDFLVQSAQSRLVQKQSLLTQQLTDYQTMQDRLAADPQVQQDPILASNIQTQLTELGVSINDTRAQISLLESETAWLISYVDGGSISKSLTNKAQTLTYQQGLLASFQALYTKLLVTGKVSDTTDQITSIEKNLSLYQQIYLNALNNRETLRLARMQNATNVVQLNPAVASASPIRPRIFFNTGMGGLAGLILSVIVILMMNSFDTTIKTRDDVERVLGLPILGFSLHVEKDTGEIPGPHVVSFPHSPASEAFRSLRTNLDYIAVDKPLKSVLISSPGASEGKTTVAINLAAIIAQSGKRVILVDADLRRPRTHSEMGLDNQVGLSDVFLEKITLKEAIQPWYNFGLEVITSGGLPPNPAELLASEKMRHILDELESMFDFVVVDSTPTIVTDSQLIAARAGGVLLILSPGSTQAESARATVEQYHHVGARLLGVVLNNMRAGQSYYGNYSPNTYYTYSQAETSKPSTKNHKAGKNGEIKIPWQKTQASKKSAVE